MSDANSGVITEDVSAIVSGATSAEDKASMIATAFGEKKEAQIEEAVEAANSVQDGELTDAATVEPEKEDDQFSTKFAALSRKEKAIREREAELEARLKEIEDKNKEIEDRFGKYNNLSERIKEKPLDVLAEEGVDFDTLIKMVLENDGKPTTEMQIEQLKSEMQNKYMKELENLREELDQKEKDAQEQRHTEVIEEYKYELNEFIDQNVEAYELIKLQGAQDLVYQVVEEHYNENGRVLSNEEACQHVEDYLLQEAKKHLESSKKIKDLLKSDAAPEPAQTEQKRVVSTLSNTESATVPSKDGRFLSDEESKREVAKLIKFIE